MTAVMMREVRCRNCGVTTRHLLPTLERIIQLQSVSLEGVTYINYACPQCSRLTRSQIEPGAKLFDGVDLSVFPDDVTVYVVSLGCAKSGCESPVILLAPMSPRTDLAGLTKHIGANWENLSATCLRGYAPSQPFEMRIAEALNLS